MVRRNKGWLETCSLYFAPRACGVVSSLPSVKVRKLFRDSFSKARQTPVVSNLWCCCSPRQQGSNFGALGLLPSGPLNAHSKKWIRSYALCFKGLLLFDQQRSCLGRLPGFPNCISLLFHR